MNIKKLIVALVALALCACSTPIFSSPEADEAARRIALRGATLVLLDGKPELAAEVVAGVDKVLAVELPETLDLAALEALTKEVLDWEKLDEEEKLLASDVLELVLAEAKARGAEIPAAEIPERVKAALLVVRGAAAVRAAQ